MGDERARILVVEDETLLAQAIGRSLRRAGFGTDLTHDAASGLAKLAGSYYDLVLIDHLLPDQNGNAVLDAAMKLDEPPVVFMMSAHSGVHDAVVALRKGAVDYLAKPLDLSDLVMRIERALESATMRRKLELLEARQRGETGNVAVSEAMRAVFALADRVAASPSSSALILGESGVGKEVVAARIHQRSRRAAAPFVKVNLGAIAESMVEAELFGSVRGAFTDSKRDRAGYFASADGGTLLLDELLEFRIELQSKLLRVLEERRFFPVGSDRERSVNVRVLAATNRSPEEAVERGELRSDLYYRLNTVCIHIPPLRERMEDVVPLAEHFLRKLGAEFGKPNARFNDATRAALVEYHWPGNVRELRNSIERAVMLSDDTGIEPDDLGIRPTRRSSSNFEIPTETRHALVRSSGTVRLSDQKAGAMEQLERQRIEEVLRLVGGSRTRAAEYLGVSRSTLWEKLKKYNLG